MSMYIVFCTFPDRDKAREAGTDLVEAQLAACVNLFPGVESIYRWQGAVETASEVLAVFKTRITTYAAFEKRLQELHPYDVPEIVAVRPDEVSADYLNWVSSVSTSPGNEPK